MNAKAQYTYIILRLFLSALIIKRDISISKLIVMRIPIKITQAIKHNTDGKLVISIKQAPIIPPMIKPTSKNSNLPHME